MADSIFSIELTVVADQLKQGTQQATDAIQSLAEETKASTEKAKASLSLLSEEFGVKMPGEIQSLIAQIPGVGAALKAAFSATVVIAIIQVLVKIAEKIEALRNKAEEHREAWIDIQTAMDETTQKTVSALDRQKAKYIEVTEGPLKAMEYELQHMQSIALSVFSSIATAMGQMAQEFAAEGGIWTVWQRENKEAGKDTKKTLADIKQAMHDAGEKAPDDLIAPLDAALGVVKHKIDEITEKINKTPTTELKSNRFEGGEYVPANQETLAVLHKQRATYQEISAELERQKGLQQQIIDTAKAQDKLAGVKDEIAAGTQVLTARKDVEDAKRKLSVDTAHFQLEQGKITADQEEEIEKAALKKEHDDTVGDLRARAQLLLRDTSLTANQRAAIIKSTNLQIAAADVKYQDDLVKADEATARKIKEAEQQKVRDFLADVQQQVASTKSGSAERVQIYKAALDKMRQMDAAGLPEFKRLQEQYNAAIREAQAKRLKDQLQLDEEEIHHNEQMALLDLDIRRKTFENEIVTHKKKSSELIAQEQQFLREELKIKVDALRQKLTVMAKDPDVNPLERRKIEDQILELEKQYALKRISVKKDEIDRKKQLEQAFEQTLQSSFSSGIMGMLQGTETFAKAMQQLYAGLAQDVVNMLGEMFAHWIATHLLMKIFGIETENDTARSNILASAASGAAAAGASVAQIPMIGWSMVAPVSEATYMQLAAYEGAVSAAGGIWEVDRDRLAHIHQAEMVMPARYAEGLRDMIESGNERPRSVQVVVNHSVNAVDAESFQGVIRRHGNMIGNEVARVLKRKGFAAKS